MKRALTSEQLLSIKLQTRFVRSMMYEAERLGCCLFLDRATHCDFWTIRVYYPVWKANAPEHSRYYAYNYKNTTVLDMAQQLKDSIAWLRESVADLCNNQMSLHQARILELRTELANLETVIVKEVTENGQTETC